MVTSAVFANLLSPAARLSGSATESGILDLMSPRLRLAALAALAVFAVAVNWQAGHRGMFLYDTSIVFDGAWRLVQGQVPYKDFAMSHAPGAYFVLEGFMRLFGVTFGTMVLAASVLNGAAALMVARIAWPVGPALGLLAGAVTALWFQPPTGYLQIEQTSFFFDCLGLWLLYEAGAELKGRAFLLRTLAGVALFYAILCKQNSGAFFVPVALAAVLALPLGSWRNRAIALAPIALGAVLCASAFTIWVFTVSDAELFWHHAVDIPRRFGSERLVGTGPWWSSVLTLISSIKLPWGPRLLSMASVPVGIAGLWLAGRGPQSHPRLRYWAALLLGITLFHSAFVNTAFNQAANGVPLIGLQLAVFAAVGSEVWRSLRGGSGLGMAQGNRLAAAVFAFLTFGVIAHGIRYVYNRGVNDFNPGTKFDTRLAVPGLERVYWGDPSYADRLQRNIVRHEDFEALVRYLRERGVNFFIFPMTNILYGLLGKPSVQPWLFFLEGHSFATADIPRLDAMALASLERNQVRIYVKERASFLGEQDELIKMPQTSQWLRDHFVQTRLIGLYEVWEWKD